MYFETEGVKKVHIKLIIPSISTSHYQGKLQSTRAKKWFHHQLLSSQKPLMTLKEIFYNNELFVRWIHCWETRNFQKPNLFMGIELLFIDSKVFLQI